MFSPPPKKWLITPLIVIKDVNVCNSFFRSYLHPILISENESSGGGAPSELSKERITMILLVLLPMIFTGWFHPQLYFVFCNFDSLILKMHWTPSFVYQVRYSTGQPTLASSSFKALICPLSLVMTFFCSSLAWAQSKQIRNCFILKRRAQWLSTNDALIG